MNKLFTFAALTLGVLTASYAFAASASVTSIPLLSSIPGLNNLNMYTLCADGNCLSTTSLQTPLSDAVLQPNTQLPIMNEIVPVQQVVPVSQAIPVQQMMQTQAPNMGGISDNMEMIVGLMQQFLDQQLQFLSGLFLITPGIGNPNNPGVAPITQPAPTNPEPTNPSPQQPVQDPVTTPAPSNPEPTQPIDQNPMPSPTNPDTGNGGDQLY